MANHGILYFSEAEEQKVQAALQNPVIKRFLESVERCANLQEVSDQVTEMLKNCLNLKADPGTILDFQKVLAVVILASDNWSSTQHEMSVSSRKSLLEIIKYLQNQADVEQNSDAKKAIERVRFLINATELTSAKQVLIELTHSDHKYRGVTALFTAVLDGVNEEKRKNMAQDYTDQAVAPIFTKITSTISKLEHDPRPNPELSTADKDFIREQLNNLDKIISYHPSLQLQQDARACRDLLMMSTEVKALSAPARLETTPVSERKVSINDPEAPPVRRRQTMTFGEHRLKEQAHNKEAMQKSTIQRSSHDAPSKSEPTAPIKKKPSKPV